MGKSFLIVALLLSVAQFQVVAQGIDTTNVKPLGDTSVVITETKPVIKLDTVITIEKIIKKPHSPHKATLMALALPGSGQIYNGQWWKVPILYGGIGATLYGIIWNNKRFVEYKDSFIEFSQYLEALSKDPNTPYPTNPAWNQIKGPMPWEEFFEKYPTRKEWFKNTLSNKKTSFKRNRDLCYIVMGAIYALNVIDACVFAHFYDFEIDDDLSLNVQPTSSYSPISGGNVGLTLTFKF